MKTVNIKWHGETIQTNLLLESYEDILEYQEMLAVNTSRTFDNMIKSRIPVDRWDHYGRGGEYGNSFNMAVQKCKIFGGRPILEFDKVTNEKCLAILKVIQRGEIVVVNSVGGWCNLMTEIHEMIGEPIDYVPKSQRQAVIKDNTKYINLENDPRLEKRTKEYLSELDKNYSYILCLNEYNQNELIEIFKEFRSKGGEIVYVYTTGTNIVQMWEYCAAIVTAQIKFVEFEFNAGYGAEHKEVVKFLIDSGVEVKLL
jgi:hypothetical protein